jgi:hypothetical protein
MIDGLPGMGQTTCLITLCRVLHRGGIVPIVFSYHKGVLSAGMRERLEPID